MALRWTWLATGGCFVDSTATTGLPDVVPQVLDLLEMEEVEAVEEEVVAEFTPSRDWLDITRRGEAINVVAYMSAMRCYTFTHLLW